MENDQLYHHGVKGMKWGVRRYQNKDGTLTARGRKRYLGTNKVTRNELDPDKKYVNVSQSTAVGNAVRAGLDTQRSKTNNAASSPTSSPFKNKITSPWAKTGMMLQNGMGYREALAGNKYVSVRSQREDDRDIVIRKGQIVQHIMSEPVKNMDGRTHLFVAATEADKKNYSGFFASLTAYRRNVDKMYSMDMETVEALVSPSKKKRVDEFLAMYESDKHNVSRELAEFNKREYGGYYTKPLEHYVKEFENMSYRQLKSEGYYTFFNSLFSSEYNRDQYFNRLKKQGYNSVVDDNDKRSFMQGEAPLIVFDAFQSLKTKRVTELTRQDMNQNMYEWAKMKHMEEGGENFKMASLYYEPELRHWGVKGMKWGVRRYQNKDGTLTPAGEARYDRQKREAGKKNKNDPAKVDQWVQDDLSRSRTLANESEQLVRKLQNANRDFIPDKPKPMMDLSQMSDKDMREQINRKILEKQYNDMFNPQAATVNRGKEYVDTTLALTGTVLGITSSALGIALAIKQLKG